MGNECRVLFMYDFYTPSSSSSSLRMLAILTEERVYFDAMPFDNYDKNKRAVEAGVVPVIDIVQEGSATQRYTAATLNAGMKRLRERLRMAKESQLTFLTGVPHPRKG